jgi:hypothetical protein
MHSIHYTLFWHIGSLSAHELRSAVLTGNSRNVKSMSDVQVLYYVLYLASKDVLSTVTSTTVVKVLPTVLKIAFEDESSESITSFSQRSLQRENIPRIP